MHPIIPVVTVALVAGMSLSPIVSPAPPPRRPDATRGLALLQHFNDSLPRNRGNALRCTSCHLDDGRRGAAMSWIRVTSSYPKYRPRRGSIETLEQRVNECVARSLSGRMLAEDGVAMRDIVAYMESLASVPAAARPDTVRLAGDTLRGATAYAANCARCHASNGGGALAPAVFGARSYSIGAGMARQKMLATFLRWNMPQDRPGTLDDQAAADIAAFVLRQPRTDYPGKERDWPNGDAPTDVAYATDGATAKGRAAPAPRPLLRRRVAPTPATAP